MGEYSDFLDRISRFVEWVEGELDVHEDDECISRDDVAVMSEYERILDSVREEAFKLRRWAQQLGLVRVAQQLQHLAAAALDTAYGNGTLCGRSFLWLYAITAQEIANILDNITKKAKR